MVFSNRFRDVTFMSSGLVASMADFTSTRTSDHSSFVSSAMTRKSVLVDVLRIFLALAQERLLLWALSLNVGVHAFGSAALTAELA